MFEGNVAEVGTPQSSLEKVMKRFPIRRVIAVAVRYLFSLDNLNALQAMRVSNGKPLDFILASVSDFKILNAILTKISLGKRRSTPNPHVEDRTFYVTYRSKTLLLTNNMSA